MSIQFRSRIVSAISSPVLNEDSSLGWCCGYGSGYTKPECIAKGGNFLPNETDAINCITTGACAENQFTSNQTGACCYWDLENEQYTQKCASVDSQSECATLHKGAAEGLQYGFYPGETCFYQGGNIRCNGVKLQPEDVANGCNVDGLDGCYSISNTLGTCCISDRVNNITSCSISTERECAYGYWVPPRYGKIQSCTNSACNGIYFSPELSTIPPVANQEELKTSDSIIEKLPNIGDQYQGGIFVGIFRPGSPLNATGSIVYGNPLCGKGASNYVARGTRSFGESGSTENKSWVLIAANEDFGVYPFYTKNYTDLIDIGTFETDDYYYSGFLLRPTSYFDGIFNQSVNLQDTIFSNIPKNYNGFSDWYIPSQDELAFFFKNISYGFNTPHFKSLSPGTYMSSTTYRPSIDTIFSDDSHIVGQVNSATEYAKNIIISKTNPANIRLFRRINLSSYASNTTKSIGLETRPDCIKCLEDAQKKANQKIKDARQLYQKMRARLYNDVDPDTGLPVDCMAGGSYNCCLENAASNIFDLFEDLADIDWKDPNTYAIILAIIALLLGVDPLKVIDAMCSVGDAFNSGFFWVGWSQPPPSGPPFGRWQEPPRATRYETFTNERGNRVVRAVKVPNPIGPNGRAIGSWWVPEGWDGKGTFKDGLNGYPQYRKDLKEFVKPVDPDYYNKEMKRKWVLYEKTNGCYGKPWGSDPVKQISTKPENRISNILKARFGKAGLTPSALKANVLKLNANAVWARCLVLLGAAGLALLYKILEDYIACIFAVDAILEEEKERLYGKKSCKCNKSADFWEFFDKCPAGSKGCCRPECSILDCIGVIGFAKEEYKRDVQNCCLTVQCADAKPPIPKCKITGNCDIGPSFEDNDRLGCDQNGEGEENADDSDITDPLGQDCQNNDPTSPVAPTPPATGTD